MRLSCKIRRKYQLHTLYYCFLNDDQINPHTKNEELEFLFISGAEQPLGQ